MIGMNDAKQTKKNDQSNYRIGQPKNKPEPFVCPHLARVHCWKSLFHNQRNNKERFTQNATTLALKAIVWRSGRRPAGGHVPSERLFEHPVTFRGKI